MLNREAELRSHPTIQRALDNIEINSAPNRINCMIDDEQYEAVLRRLARMKSGELKAQLRQLGVNPKGSTATVRSATLCKVFTVCTPLTNAAEHRMIPCAYRSRLLSMAPLLSISGLDATRTKNAETSNDDAHQPQDMQEALSVRLMPGVFSLRSYEWTHLVPVNPVDAPDRMCRHVMQLIEALRLKLQRHQDVQFEFAGKPVDDAQIFHSIKERVIEEFGLPKEYVDILYSAESRFPGDADVINSAGYLKYNRSKQGTINVGDVVPMHEMPMASLDGTVATLAERLADDPRPVVLVAGSIT